MITQERLKELFYYHPESGDFVRLITLCGRAIVGHQTGTLNSNGYLVIVADGKAYKAHRLAFLYMTGEWPISDSDHRDTVKHHNWWTNLRPATRRQNSFNRGANANSVTGLKMISWHRRDKHYRVQTNIAGKKKIFTTTKSLEFAVEVAAQVVLAFHSDFARAA